MEMHGIVGKWQHVKSENFEDFLRENGANFVIRKMAGKSNPSMEITRNENEFTVKISLPMKTQEEVFKIGEEYETVFHQNNQKCKALATIDAGKLVIDYTPADPKEKSQKIIREVNGDELITTMTVGDVVCKRFFKRVE